MSAKPKRYIVLNTPWGVARARTRAGSVISTVKSRNVAKHPPELLAKLCAKLLKLNS